MGDVEADEDDDEDADADETGGESLLLLLLLLLPVRSVNAATCAGGRLRTLVGVV